MKKSLLTKNDKSSTDTLDEERPNATKGTEKIDAEPEICCTEKEAEYSGANNSSATNEVEEKFDNDHGNLNIISKGNAEMDEEGEEEDDEGKEKEDTDHRESSPVIEANGEYDESQISIPPCGKKIFKY